MEKNERTNIKPAAEGDAPEFSELLASYATKTNIDRFIRAAEQYGLHSMPGMAIAIYAMAEESEHHCKCQGDERCAYCRAVNAANECGEALIEAFYAR